MTGSLTFETAVSIRNGLLFVLSGFPRIKIDAILTAVGICVFLSGFPDEVGCTTDDDSDG